MKPSEYIKKLLGMVPEEQRAALEAEAAKLEAEGTTAAVATPPVVAGGASSGGNTSALEQRLAASEAKVQQLLDALVAEKTERERGVEAQQSLQKQQREKDIKDQLDTAVREGRIAAEKRDFWAERMKTDFDGAKVILSELSPNPAIAKSQGQQQGTNGQQAAKTTRPTEESTPVNVDDLVDDAAGAFRSGSARIGATAK